MEVTSSDALSVATGVAAVQTKVIGDYRPMRRKEPASQVWQPTSGGGAGASTDLLITLESMPNESKNFSARNLLALILGTSSLGELY